MFTAKQQIGPYILVKKLGRGGFGEVWLAERRTEILTTKVAIKLPLQTQIDIEEVKREATLWEKVSGHPNVLPIIEANVYDGQIVIVSEYASDGSLEDVLKREGSLSIKKSIELMSGVLSGLEFLHSRRIIHRDLKPANILLQGNTPRLADFGISRALRMTQTSSSNTISGTWEYMAPEAFDGKRNEQTDVWSAGVTLYKLLTRRLPFPQTEPTALVGAIMTRNPDPLPVSIPESLREIVLCALSKNPDERFKSPLEMHEALRKVNVKKTSNNTSRFAFLDSYNQPIDSEITTIANAQIKETSVSITDSPEEPSLLKNMLKHYLFWGGLVFLFGILITPLILFLNAPKTTTQNVNQNSNQVTSTQPLENSRKSSSPIPSPSPSPTPTSTPSLNFDLSRLNKYVGKYPFELFKKEPSFQRRLRTFLGSNYNDFDSNFTVQSPISKEGNFYILEGCRAHHCDYEESKLVVDVVGNAIHCAIISFGKRERVYSENKQKPPAILRHLIDEAKAKQQAPN
jgi:serine/threonine protein kinase